MKQTILLFAAFLLFGYTGSLAQTHFIKLSDERINLSPLPFTVTKVIDQRTDKSNIGWTQKGMSNTKVNADFSSNLESEVLEFLQHNLVSDGPKIQMIIRTLNISEKTGFSKETGSCELSVDFFLEDGPTFYRVLHTSVVTEVTSGMDVTKKQPQNIAEAFRTSFERLALVDLSEKENFLALSSLEETDRTIPDSIMYNYPLFREAIKTGVYADFEELKNNAPSNTEPFYIEKRQRMINPWFGTFEIIPKFEASNQRVKKVWAIAIDGEVYVYHQREFFPLTIDNYQLYFQGYGIPSGQSVSTGALVGGLIGAGIASGIENANAKKQKVTYYIEPHTGGVARTVLEMTAN